MAPPEQQPQIIVLGSNSLVAPFLLQRLAGQGAQGLCLSRSAPRTPPAPGFSWHAFDAERPQAQPFPAGSVLYSLLPLWLLPAVLPLAAQCAQVVAFGSTSVFSKQHSGDPAERALAARLQQAEEALARWSAANGVPWTLLRPTLVYDGRTDANVTALARMIRRFGLLPVAAPARGLRQPIHAEDLALAALAAAGNPRLFGRGLNLVGGETLTYRQMVERIFAGLALAPRIVPLPPMLLRIGFRMLRTVPRFSRYSPAMFTRMNEDLAFDDGESRALLGFTPRAFHPRWNDGEP